MRKFLLLPFLILGCAEGSTHLSTTSSPGTGGETSIISSSSSLPEGGNGACVNLRPLDKLSFDLGFEINGEVSYKNGPVMVDPVNVYYLYYGNLQSQTVTILEDFASNVGKSDWFQITSQYYQLSDAGADSKQFVTNQINFAGSQQFSTIYGSILTDQNVIDLISQSKFTLDNNSIVVLLLSKGITQTGMVGASCLNFCRLA